MTSRQLLNNNQKWINNNVSYTMTKWYYFNYKIMNHAFYYCKRGRGARYSVNEVFIMVDTETSKKPNNPNNENHVCAFSIAIRMYHKNIVTLYGNKPSECIKAMTKIHNNMNGDKTFFYIHNLNYDYVFLRKFMFKTWGYPKHELIIKSHAPIEIEFENGIVLRDSLILSQRSLEKWAEDMNVEHQKAVGAWNYDLIRNQNCKFTEDEKRYIENDVLAGVECLDALSQQLKVHLVNMPYTATGIPRKEVQKRGAENYARRWYEKGALTYEQYIKATKVFHGGYTHANRFISGQVIDEGGDCYDFSSSYPYVLLSERYPVSKWLSIDNKSIDYILKYSEQYAFMFKLILVNPHIKKGAVMPTLQASKCVVKINPILDNGRILVADYVEIYTNEIDLQVLSKHYDYDNAYCVEVEFATKAYLPRWFTDYIYELYRAKCELKGVEGKAIEYALAKAKLNSLYGLCAMKNVRDNISENYETGEYFIDNKNDPESMYNKYINSHKTILNYVIGCYVTSYSFRNLHTLGEAVASNGIWLYSDTDSCYATKWDIDKINAYNEECKRKLRANGYGAVVVNNKEFWLGVAEHDGDHFTEFITQGAKRYCKRENGKLKITVAGVPKKAVVCLNDDIYNFRAGMVFTGVKSGKLTHKYIYVDDIYIDENGNETGDSIDLSPCDYVLSHDGYNEIDEAETIEEIFNIKQEVQIYE